MEIFIQTKNRIDILHQIISKGGLYGSCAKLYLNDSMKSHQFLLECSEQCHHQSLIDFFGNELIEDIINYSNVSKEFMLQIL